MIKVSILTQPLGENYGGLLQAYALQVSLRRLGCDVETLDLRNPAPIKASYFLNLKIRKILYSIGFISLQGRRERRFKNMRKFKSMYISMSPFINKNSKILSYYSKNKFDAFVVGSDQVWRPSYSPDLPSFFLEFCEILRLPGRRIAYAASFGVNTKEFALKDIERFKTLAEKFNAISVREDCGIRLCEEYFHLSVEKALDPTLLLDRVEYEDIINKDCSKGWQGCGGLLVYILDMEESKQGVINKISSLIDEHPYYLMGQEINNSKTNEKASPYPSVGDWMNSFKSAKFVVTDSFHGCIFSIIFNKPFLAIGNVSRGLSRFTSLLSMLGLENRLISAYDEVSEGIVFDEINWSEIDAIIKLWREKSINFLANSIYSK